MELIKHYGAVVQTVKKGKIEQLHFKGDPMHRPVMSREVGFLVRWLVSLSEWCNHRLGLDQSAQDGELADTQIQVRQHFCTHGLISMAGSKGNNLALSLLA